jgi:hypothetical protein
MASDWLEGKKYIENRKIQWDMMRLDENGVFFLYENLFRN